MSRNYTIKMFIFVYMIGIELNYVPLDDAASTTSSVNLLIFQRRTKNFYVWLSNDELFSRKYFCYAKTTTSFGALCASTFPRMFTSSDGCSSDNICYIPFRRHYSFFLFLTQSNRLHWFFLLFVLQKIRFSFFVWLIMVEWSGDLLSSEKSLLDCYRFAFCLPFAARNQRPRNGARQSPTGGDQRRG